MSNQYIHRLEELAQQDARTLKKKDKEYGSSWKNRGGVGAFMMMARKWDRIENAVSDGDNYKCIFSLAKEDSREEGILDDIGDLRRYLLLLEAEIRERASVDEAMEHSRQPTSPTDTKHVYWASFTGDTCEDAFLAKDRQIAYNVGGPNLFLAYADTVVPISHEQAFRGPAERIK